MKTAARQLLIAFFCLSPLALTAGAALGQTEDLAEQMREAASAGDEARVRALLDRGLPVDAPARHGRTALIFAAGKGHVGVVRLLLERGADVNTREQFFGWSAVDAALHAGSWELVRLLLERGAEDADTVLWTALERDDAELARLALASGKIEPLGLAAARREAANASQALRDLLAAAVATRRERPPHHPSAARLETIAGRYNTRDGLLALTVTVRGESLELSRLGQSAPLVVAPVVADRFDSADGKLSAVFSGRGGTIERVLLNHDGELSFFSKAPPSDPTLLRTAAAATTEGAEPARDERGASPRVPRPWPQFRGPGSAGVADGQGAPTRWNVETGEGIRFKTPIPGLALSSPIVWGERIYVTTAVPSQGQMPFNTDDYDDLTPVNDGFEQSFRLYALDTAQGRVIWEREIHRGIPGALRHIKSSLANSTPVTDGERVVVLFGAVGKLAAYDKDGKQLWLRDVGILDSTDPPSGTAGWGHASSLILVGELVIVQADRRTDSFLAAFDLKTGEERWRVARSDPPSWATPTLVAAPTGDELVVNATTIRGYDPKTGAELWHLGPSSEVVVSTPQTAEGLIFVTAGYPPVRPVYAIRTGRRGDLSLPADKSTSPDIAWSYDRGGTYIPSPIVYRGFLHTCNNNGIFTTYRASTGELLSTQRLSQGGIGVSASPVAADGRLYVFAESGEAYVLASGPEPALLGKPSVGESVMATPAISGGLMVVRTLGHVIGLEVSGGER